MDVGSSRTVTVNRRCPGVEDIQIRKEGKNEKNRRQWMPIRSNHGGKLGQTQADAPLNTQCNLRYLRPLADFTL